MKLKVIIFLCLFLFTIDFASAQQKSGRYDFVKNNISYLNTTLTQGGASTLNEAQLARMEKIFATKEQKWKELTAAKLQKDKFAEAWQKVELEYAPQVEAILSTEQKAAYRKHMEIKD